MLYNAPLDQLPSNPNAPYTDGVPSAGIQGSIVSAACCEFDQREIVEVITRANVRGYTDFSGAACAIPGNNDLTQLRKAIEGFIAGINVYIISTEITFTVHGPGANFPDLIAAFAYLGKYRITPTGHVILQLAGASSGHAQQWTYTQQVTIDHPNNDRISVLGAPMLKAVPLDDTGYASNGSSSAQRAADTATNLAILRNCFATELHFANGVSGFDIVGLSLQHLDAILLTGTGSASGVGFLWNASGYLNIAPVSSSTGNWAYGGLAAVQFNSGFNWDVGSSISLQGEAVDQSFVSPLIACGCYYGMIIGNGGFLTSSGNIISLGNDSAGFMCWPRAGNQLAGGVFCSSNGGNGYNT